jgi:hypothetical protein
MQWRWDSPPTARRSRIRPEVEDPVVSLIAILSELTRVGG